MENISDSNSFLYKEKRLLLIALSLVLIVAAAAFYFYKNFQNTFIEQKKTELKLLADNVAADHEGSMYGIRQFLITSEYLVDQMKVDDASCRSILQRMYVVYPYFLNIGITDSEGDVVCSGAEIGRAITLAEDEDFIRAKSSGSFTVSGYRISRISGRPSVRFLHPLVSGGEFEGVIFMTFDTDWLNGFANTFDPPPGTTITKFDRDGIVFMRYPNPLTWSGTDQADSNLFKSIQELRSGYIKASGLDGKERIYYFRPIHLEGEIHAYVTVGSDETTLLAR